MKKLEPWIVPTLGDVARFFSISLKTAEAWRALGMPGTPGRGRCAGRYDLRGVLRWRDALQEERRQRKGTARRGREDPDLRWKTAKAEYAELRVAKWKGSLIPRRDHEEYVLKLITLFRNALFSLGTSLPYELRNLDLTEQFALVRERHRELLEDLSRGRTDWSLPADGTPPGEDLEGGRPREVDRDQEEGPHLVALSGGPGGPHTPADQSTAPASEPPGGENGPGHP